MTPSVYQQRIYDFIQNGQGNAVINAVAGSGKSTTLVGALGLLPQNKKALFVAFNKEIVNELITKVFSTKEEVSKNRENALKNASVKMRNSNITIQTLHSLGFSAIRYSNKAVQVDDRKYRTYLRENFDSLKPDSSEIEDRFEYMNKVLSLVDLGRVNLCKTVEELLQIGFKHGVEIINGECELALELIKWGSNNVKTIDFTDMIYLPIIKDMRCFQYDFVFVDECQDLNACQRLLFLKMMSASGRFVAVGDPFQSIYGFAGADIESFNLLKTIPNTIELPLSVCYRCDNTIINLAKSIVPQIEARPGAGEGVVNNEALLADIRVNDMVLCRITAPLVDLCYKFISQGIPAYIKGRDIASNLINIVEKTKRTNIIQMFDVLNYDRVKLINNIMRKTSCTYEEAVDTSLIQSFDDKVQCLEVLSVGCENTEEIKVKINRIFNETKEGVVFSTVHRSKGLENERVFIVCPDRLPLVRKGMKAWQKDQEKNLEYVAYTRAKSYLGFVSDYDYNNRK